MADPTETLVDTITHRVLNLLALSLHDCVAAAVRALAPEMLISFPSTPPVPERPRPAADPEAEPGATPVEGVLRSLD